MTRAEDRLYICGWEGLKRAREGIVWYDLVKDGLAGLLTAHVGSDGRPRAAAWKRADRAREGRQER